MTIDWFRKPAEDDAGTLNACFNTLDRHVIRGHADDVAMIDAETEKPVTYARLLTQAAAFGGALKVLGVGPGDRVGWSWGLNPRGIVALLGCLRIGAVPVVGSMEEIHECPARVIMVGWAVHLSHFPPREGRTIVVGAGGEDVEGREDVVPWSTLMQAGNAQPAACEEMPGDAILWTTPGISRDTTVPDLLALAEGGPHRDAPSWLLSVLLRGGEWSGNVL